MKFRFQNCRKGELQQQRCYAEDVAWKKVNKRFNVVNPIQQPRVAVQQNNSYNYLLKRTREAS